ncbi:MAG: spore germination protein [Alicyclobacillus herbarius]|uniref:spore germination protein n=1 Tax=Alicyclobacillus herbarius TaxID=122960 RepID=UPI002355419D|nr:spore germination protein [Alicyclobacillus herbarius]MCL6632816.1 spore germination protein [Alicyclobacillus herbarius]
MTIWRRAKKTLTNPLPPDEALRQHRNRKFDGQVQKSVRFIEEMLGENDDLVIRSFRIFHVYDAVAIYFANIVNRETSNEAIFRPLMKPPSTAARSRLRGRALREVIVKEVLHHEEVYLRKDLIKVVEDILRGNTVVLVQHCDEVIVIATRRVPQRNPDQPETEQVIRGARDGFVEQLSTNITLLRYRLQTPNLRVKMMTIGQLTKTKVAVCYIEGVARPVLVQEVLDRLKSIETDSVLDAGTLEQFIEDNHWSPFPQVQNSERPDKCVASLLEGRVVILTDATPFSLIVPAVFVQFNQTMDDYSERWLMSSLIRFVRLVALIFSFIFPSLYVAIIAFNPELIPTKFAVAVAGGRAGVPFPAVIEVLLMEVSMEVLREATLRLPQQVGGALSIVGVLIIGQAAVAAGFASPITVVIIALTTIGSFATPAYNAAIALRILRFVLTILAGLFGLYGVVVGLILVSNHMLSLRSFGIPYLSPVVPLNWEGLKDALIRAPLWSMWRRPKQLNPVDHRRLSPDTLQKMMEPRSHTLDPVKPRRLK